MLLRHEYRLYDMCADIFQSNFLESWSTRFENQNIGYDIFVLPFHEIPESIHVQKRRIYNICIV